MSSVMLEMSELKQWSVIRFLSFENSDMKLIKIYEWLKHVRQFNYECTVRVQMVLVISWRKAAFQRLHWA